MGWTSPYTYKGYTYKAGDPIVVNGDYYYDISDTTPNGTLNTTKYFHGVWVNDDGSLALNPVGIRNSASSTSPNGGTIRFESIVSGGTANTCTITINMNGGTATNNFTSIKTTIGTNTGYTFNGYQPTRVGHSFKGLYTAKSGGTQVYNSSGVCVGDGTYWSGSGESAKWIYQGNVTLYAQWTTNTYTLTIMPNGGTWGDTTANTAIKQEYGSTKAIDNPKRTGYRFTGWTLRGSGTFKNGTYTYGAGHGTLSANWVPIYYLDLNVYLNDAITKDTSIFNCDVTVGGSVVGTDVCDYYKQHDAGSEWSITDLTTASGYTRYKTEETSGTLTEKATCRIYIGKNYTVTYVANGDTVVATQTVNYGTSWTTEGAICSKIGYTQASWNTKADGTGTKYDLNTAQTSTQDSDLTLYAIYKPNTYHNSISHLATGFNGEGNNYNGTAFRLANTYFYGTYGSSYTLGADRSVGLPNGFYISDIGTGDISGSWSSYDLGVSFMQKDKALSCDYYYRPYDYKITYVLDGGTNNASNPSAYNVLYGVTFKEPTRNNYKFLGWYLNDVKVTGINEGCNATFSSVEDLYNGLAKRSTGAITLVAKWEMIANFYVKDNGAYKPGICYVKHNGVYKRTQVLAKDAGSYKYGGCS